MKFLKLLLLFLMVFASCVSKEKTSKKDDISTDSNKNITGKNKLNYNSLLSDTSLSMQHKPYVENWLNQKLKEGYIFDCDSSMQLNPYILFFDNRFLVGDLNKDEVKNLVISYYVMDGCAGTPYEEYNVFFISKNNQEFELIDSIPLCRSVATGECNNYAPKQHANPWPLAYSSVVEISADAKLAVSFHNMNKRFISMHDPLCGVTPTRYFEYKDRALAPTDEYKCVCGKKYHFKNSNVDYILRREGEKYTIDFKLLFCSKACLEKYANMECFQHSSAE